MNSADLWIPILIDAATLAVVIGGYEIAVRVADRRKGTD